VSLPSRSTIVTMLALASIIGAGACSSGSSGNISDRTVPPATTAGTDVGPTRTIPPAGTGPQSTVGGPGGARIDDLAVANRLTCDLGSHVSITATYRTSGTVEVAFVLDGSPVPGAPPTSGTFDLDVPCDGTAHTLVLTAVDDRGRTTVASKAILTGVDPAGD
jgi:hypothetical protein